MSENEVKEYLKKAKEYIKTVSASKDSAQQLLKSTGIYTSTGRLSKHYQ